MKTQLNMLTPNVKTLKNKLRKRMRYRFGAACANSLLKAQKGTELQNQILV